MVTLESLVIPIINDTFEQNKEALIEEFDRSLPYGKKYIFTPEWYKKHVTRLITYFAKIVDYNSTFQNEYFILKEDFELNNYLKLCYSNGLLIRSTTRKNILYRAIATQGLRKKNFDFLNKNQRSISPYYLHYRVRQENGLIPISF